MKAQIHVYEIIILQVIISLITAFQIPAQNALKIDSLLNALRNASIEKDPAGRTKILTELASEQSVSSPSVALEYARQALKLAQKLGDREKEAGAVAIMSEAYCYLEDYTKATDYTFLGLRLFQELDNKDEVATLYNNLGYIYEKKGDYPLSMEYFLKGLKLHAENGNKEGMATTDLNLGLLYYSWSRGKEAIAAYEEAYKLAKEIDDKELIAVALNNLGLSYSEEGNEEKTIGYYKEAIDLYRETGDQDGVATSMANIGIYYGLAEQYKDAWPWLNDALSIFRKIKGKRGIAWVQSTIACFKQKAGDTNGALKDFYESMTFAKEIAFLDALGQIYEGLSDTYAATERYDSAMHYYRMYAELKDSLFNEESLRQISEMQARYETEKKEKEIEILNKDKLLKEAELQKRKEESARQRVVIYSFILGLLIILIFSLMLYRQYKAKKRANVLLARQNEEIKQQKEEIEAQRDEIESQRDEIEAQRDLAASQRDLISEQKQEILDSIHYAQRIQKAILPPEEYVTKSLPEHFIFFQPRDIVSGDFYWATTIVTTNIVDTHSGYRAKSRYRAYLPIMVVAAADCTGHGVPGAFMSMLGITLLNEIVSRDVNYSAADILNSLRENLISSLHQRGGIREQGDHVVRDGMDIALCILDLNTNELQYAGANNPLYIIRNPDPQGYINSSICHRDGSGPDIGNLAGQGFIKIKPDLSAETDNTKNKKHILHEVKADKMPIGIYHGAVEKSFTNHLIQMNPGDLLYIFSDGFADQFGGPKGKKFKYQKLKELIISICNTSLEEQKKALKSAFDEWVSHTDPVTG
ncbi:MAG: tetratricopeptide repeat protein, partial [Bacteroidetes bacterium]|nr:tetratricopeptide repeat protein [Bacteroidota bacterium]